jgi:hypothetical protein
MFLQSSYTGQVVWFVNRRKLLNKLIGLWCDNGGSDPYRLSNTILFPASRELLHQEWFSLIIIPLSGTALRAVPCSVLPHVQDSYRSFAEERVKKNVFPL